tara:strand:+ start:1219 stop:2208 length:990 start_codon:yes stop_codon:yes gene_type:complete
MTRDRVLSGPYTMDSYIRGYNDGFYAGRERNPYLDISPEARGYIDGFVTGREDSSVSRFGETERQLVQVSQRERGLKTSRGQFSMTEGELVEIEPINVPEPPPKATGEEHEEVRGAAFELGEDHAFGHGVEPDDRQPLQDWRDQDFDHWMEWVATEGFVDADFSPTEAFYNDSMVQRLAQSAQEGYVAGWQHVLTPEAPINSDDDININDDGSTTDDEARYDEILEQMNQMTYESNFGTSYTADLEELEAVWAEASQQARWEDQIEINEYVFDRTGHKVYFDDDQMVAKDHPDQKTVTYGTFNTGVTWEQLAIDTQEFYTAHVRPDQVE